MRTVAPVSELGFHLTWRLVDDRPIAPSAEARRVLAEALLGAGADAELFVFGAADTHLHAGVACGREVAGRFAQRVAVTLRARLKLEVRFEAARVRPFRDAWHRQNTLAYVLRQAEHHGLAGDALREASALPDLLGLRLVDPSLVPRARALFPRLRRADLLGWAGWTDVAEGFDAACLRDAVLGAAALADLTGHTARANAARVAGVAVGRAALGLAETARRLGIGERTAQRLAGSEADPLLTRAIRLQMGLRSAVAAANAPVVFDSGGRAYGAPEVAG